MENSKIRNTASSHNVDTNTGMTMENGMTMDPKQFGRGVATDAASELMPPGNDGRVASPGPTGDRGVATDAASDLMPPGSDGRVASPGPTGDRVVDATEPNESVDDEPPISALQPSTYDLSDPKDLQEWTESRKREREQRHEEWTQRVRHDDSWKQQSPSRETVLHPVLQEEAADLEEEEQQHQQLVQVLQEEEEHQQLVEVLQGEPREPPHMEARGTADTHMPGTAPAKTQPEFICRPEDLMSVEEDQQLLSPGDNTQQRKDEEEQSTGHKKPLSDKDKDTIVFNRGVGLIKAINSGKSKWLKLKVKLATIATEYQGKEKALYDLLNKHPAIGVKLIAHKQAGEQGLVKPGEWLMHALTNEKAPTDKAARPRNRNKRPHSNPTVGNRNATPRQSWT